MRLHFCSECFAKFAKIWKRSKRLPNSKISARYSCSSKELQNACSLGEISADRVENERKFAEKLTIFFTQFLPRSGGDASKEAFGRYLAVYADRFLRPPPGTEATLPCGTKEEFFSSSSTRVFLFRREGTYAGRYYLPRPALVMCTIKENGWQSVPLACLTKVSRDVVKRCETTLKISSM